MGAGPGSRGWTLELGWRLLELGGAAKEFLWRGSMWIAEKRLGGPERDSGNSEIPRVV